MKRKSVAVPTFQKRFCEDKRKLATLVPLGALEAIAHASEIGLIKYKRDGYREGNGYQLSCCLDAAVRHIMKRTSGERYDPEGSEILKHPIDHLDCAIWNLSAACEMLRLYGEINDDLWKGPQQTGK